MKMLEFRYFISRPLFGLKKYNTKYVISVYVLLNGSATVFRLISPYPRYTATQCKIGEVYRVSMYLIRLHHLKFFNFFFSRADGVKVIIV